MQKRYSVPIAVGDRAHFTVAGTEESKGYLDLTKLEMSGGVLSWEMVSNKGQVLIGNTTAETRNPLFSDKFWVKPKIPITMHLRKGYCVIVMMFCIPTAVRIDVDKNVLPQ